jgi:catechol 2,3-dioxygenase-like lactoylglutathione lyase family enzyme
LRFHEQAVNQIIKETAMKIGTVEHVNVTVTNPEATAKWLCDVFGWHVRWSGASIHGGTTHHVGSDTSYLAVYVPATNIKHPRTDSYNTKGGLNHVGVVVEDIAETEQKVIAAGFTPHSHADYEPGRRFYFNDSDGIEFEVVAYA